MSLLFQVDNPWRGFPKHHRVGDLECPECDTWWGDDPRRCKNPDCRGGVVHVEYGDEGWDPEDGEWLLFIHECDVCGKEYE